MIAAVRLRRMLMEDEAQIVPYDPDDLARRLRYAERPHTLIPSPSPSSRPCVRRGPSSSRGSSRATGSGPPDILGPAVIQWSNGSGTTAVMRTSTPIKSARTAVSGGIQGPWLARPAATRARGGKAGGNSGPARHLIPTHAGFGAPRLLLWR